MPIGGPGRSGRAGLHAAHDGAEWLDLSHHGARCDRADQQRASIRGQRNSGGPEPPDHGDRRLADSLVALVVAHVFFHFVPFEDWQHGEDFSYFVPFVAIEQELT